MSSGTFNAGPDNSGGGTLTIPSGTTSPVTLTIAAMSDSTSELDEPLTLTLNGGDTATRLPDGWGIDDSSNDATITINANENTIAFALNAMQIPEMGGSATITATIDQPIPAGTTPAPTIAITPGGSATRETDYRLSTAGSNNGSISGNTWTLPTGRRSAALTIMAEDDLVVEDPDETISLGFADGTLPTGWMATPATHSITITDNDGGSIGFMAQTSETSEDDANNNNVTHNVMLSVTSVSGSIPNAPIMLVVQVGGSTATSGSGGDFTITSPLAISTTGNVPFPVTILHDDTAEGPEEIVLEIPQTGNGLPAGWELGTRTHTVRIAPSDNTIGFAASGSGSAATPPVEPSGSAGTNYDVPLVLSNTPAADFTVAFAITVNGATRASSTSGAGDFFAQTSHTVVVADVSSDGETSYPVTILPDNDAEADEMFTITFAASQPNLPRGWTVDASNNSYTVTIPANDNTIGFAASSSDSAATPPMEPSGSAGTNYDVPLVLSNTPAADFMVAFAITPNGATRASSTSGAGDFFAQTPHTVVVAGVSGGRTSYPVTILPDDDAEADEMFTITLAASQPDLPIGWTVDTNNNSYTVTIPANDNTIGFVAPVAGSVAAPAVEPSGSTGTNYDVPLVLSNTPAVDFTIAFDITLNGATRASSTSGAGDFFAQTPHTIAVAGVSSGRTSYPIVILPDADAEVDEMFTIAFAASQADLPTGWTVDANNNSYAITIPANDNIIRFASMSPSTILEDGETTASVTVSINQPIPSSHAGTVTVTVNRSNTTGTTEGTSGDYTISGTGYDASSGVLTLPRTGAADLTVTAVDDIELDPNGRFTLSLSNLTGAPSGWSIDSTTEHVVNITDDEVPPTAAIGFVSTESEANEPDMVDPSNPPVHGVSLAITNTAGRLTTDANVMLELEGTADRDGADADATLLAMQAITPADFANGSVSYSILLIPDDKAEGDETITIRLTQGGLPVGWSLGTETEHVVTIPANDNVIGFTESAPAELNERAQSYAIPVHIHSHEAQNITFTVRIDGTDHANNPIADISGDIQYSPLIAFNASDMDEDDMTEGHQDMANISVTVREDGMPENTETFTIMLIPEGLAGILAGFDETLTHTFTVPAHGNTIEFATSSSANISESSGSAIITIRLSNPIPSDENVSVRLSFTGATEGTDFTITDGTARYNAPSAGRLALPTGEIEATFTLVAVGNDTAAADKSIVLTIDELDGEPDGWGMLGEQMVHDITITDDDKNTIGFALTGVEADSRTIEVNEDVGTVSLTLQLSQSDGTSYTGNIPAGLILSHDGTRTDSSDFSIQFTNSTEGIWSARTNDNEGSVSVLTDTDNNGSIPITIMITDDDVAESRKTFSYTFQEATRFPADTWELDPEADDFTLVINDDDKKIGFAANSPNEANEENGSFTVTVNILPQLTEEETVILTLGGGAEEGVDYTIESDHYDTATDILTLPAETDDVVLTITPDNDSEGDDGKTIELTLAERTDPNELPAGRSIDPATHTVTLRDNDRSFGFTTTADSFNAVPPVLREGSVLTITLAPEADDVAAFAALPLAADVALTVEMSHEGSSTDDDYTLTQLTLDRETGVGSFTVTADDDAEAEDFDRVTLTITEPTGTFLPGWKLPDPISVTFAGSDNAVRFAQWDRSSPGSFAGLSATISEGDVSNNTANMVVLMTNLAPHGDLPVLIDVEEGYEEDITFEEINPQENRSDWDDASNILTIKRKHIGQEPNLAAGLRIVAVNDMKTEGSETFTITIRHPGSIFPDYWGAVANESDTGMPVLETSLAFELTIDDDDEGISFDELSSNVTEGMQAKVDILIVPPLAENAMVLLTPSSDSGAGNYSITATSSTIPPASYNPTDDVLMLPAGADKVTLTVAVIADTNRADGTITLTLTEQAGGLPGTYEVVSNRSVHTLAVREPRTIGIMAQSPTLDIRLNHDRNGRIPLRIQSASSRDTVGYEPHFVHVELNEPGTGAQTAVTVNVAATTNSSLFSDMGDDISLDVVAHVDGDLTLHQQYRNNPVNPSGSEDFTISPLTVDPTGSGSFTFTVNDDNFAEGREIVTLTLADTKGNLPEGWTLATSSYHILIEANDNSAGFAEDNALRFRNIGRQMGGAPASLKQTIQEGEIVSGLILLTHQPSAGSFLQFEVDVPSDHENDIRIRPVNAPTSVFSIIPLISHPTDRYDIDPSGTPSNFIPHISSSPPRVATGFAIHALTDSLVEGTEVVTLTLRENRGGSTADFDNAFSSGWGAVRNFTDMGDHNGNNRVETSTTIELTILDGTSNIFFDEANSEIIGEGSVNVDVRIVPPLDELESVSLTTVGGDMGDYSISATSSTTPSASYNDGILTLPSGTDRVTLTLTANADADNRDETIILTLAERAAPDDLPNTHSIMDGATHELVIRELRSISFVASNPTDDIRWPQSGFRVGFQPHFVHKRLDEPGGEDTTETSTTISVVATTESSLLDGITLDVVATMMGDPVLHPMYRNEPVNADGTDDFNISTLTLGAQQGSFTFTVNEDGIAEGREIVMLTLADTRDNLPEGWTLDDSNPYYILIEANDNAARFAEWPRENSGGEASLNLTIEEEDDPATAEKENEGTVVVLLTSLFPPEPGLSSLPFAIRVSSEHNQDVDFEVIDGDPLTGGGPTRFIRQSGNIHFFFVRYFPALRVAGMRPNGTPASEPYLAARLKIRAVNDTATEGNETVTLTLIQPSNFPKGWGSVTALPDIGYHIGQNPVKTSTTVTITIPANDEPSSSPSPPPNPSGFGRGFQREAQAH